VSRLSLLVAFAALLAIAKSSNPPLDVVLVTDEADAVVSVAGRVERGDSIPARDYDRLFATQGFEHLQERSAKFGGPIARADFIAFVDSLGRSHRVDAYSAALARLEATNLASAARLAEAYLPAGTRIRARLYLEIKPAKNSFVFTGSDSLPPIFLAVQPGTTPAQATNTLAHELHHVGTQLACRGAQHPEGARVGAAPAKLLEYLTALGEGRAMLAAAGGPDKNPHAADDDSIQRRWNRDVGKAAADIAELSSFANDVLDGRITSADSVERRGNSYFGVQGPWYTVGWLMASTVERQLGRRALIATTCDPVAFLSAYNVAARHIGGRSAPPLWPDSLLARLTTLTGRTR